MNNIYSPKKLLKFSFILGAVLSIATVFNSCKDDDDDGYSDHLAQFEVKITTGMKFDVISTQVGTAQPKTLFEDDFTDNQIVWKSDEFFVNSSQSALFLSAKSVGINQDSKLIATIYLDGEVKRSDTLEGAGLHNAQINYHFLDIN